jgi:hypothetical protein
MSFIDAKVSDYPFSGLEVKTEHTFGAASRITTRWPRRPSVKAAAMPPMPKERSMHALEVSKKPYNGESYRPYAMLATQFYLHKDKNSYPTTMTSKGTFA